MFSLRLKSIRYRFAQCRNDSLALFGREESKQGTFLADVLGQCSSDDGFVAVEMLVEKGGCLVQNDAEMFVEVRETEVERAFFP